jgi:diguanylate cyclase (GGDEF)-like protein
LTTHCVRTRQAKGRVRLPEARRTARRCGADDWLTKAVRQGELKSRLIAARRVTDLHAKVATRDADLIKAKAGAFGVARRDPLTGLGNRLGLSEDLAALDAETRRYGHSYCIALCELDRRKRCEGPETDVADDHVLSAVGRVLRQECRGTDFAYRPGGEEIVVVLPDRTPDSAGMALERMRRAAQALAIPDSEDDSTGVVTMSAGLATRGPRDEKRGALRESPMQDQAWDAFLSPNSLSNQRSVG